MDSRMDGNIPEMKSWSPPHPKFSWFFVALVALTGLLPFLTGMLAIVIKTPFPSFFDSGRSTAILSSAFFTMKQATISSLVVGLLAPVFGVSLVFATPRGLRTSYLLRTLVFCLPSLVVASGIIVAWGKNGLATRLLESLGIDLPIAEIIYSPYAVVLANTLMNLPFASLMIFRCLMELPGEQVDSATLLGLRPFTALKCVIWPAIKPVLFYFSGMTFLLSLGSFGALSILGGGPASQTLELGIYQSIYFDGDWPAAALFAFTHASLAGFVALLFIGPQYRWLDAYLSQQIPANLSVSKLRPLFYRSKSIHWMLVMTNYALDLCILAPITALLVNSFQFLILGNSSTLQLLAPLLESLKVSLGFAIPAAMIATFIAWLVTRAFCRYKLYQRPKFGVAMLLGVFGAGIIPGMAAAFGLLVLRSMLPAQFFGSPAIIAIHTTLILPFLINILLPLYSQKLMPFENSRMLLGLSEFRWLRIVEWRAMGQGLASALAVGLALSLNETAIVSMLGDPLRPVLTTTMIRLMGHYRFGESAIGSCLLILTTFTAILFLSPRGRLLNDAA